MTSITRYLFGDELAMTIATRTHDQQHWYMAKDICNILEIKNHSQAVHGQRSYSLTEDEWMKETNYIGGYGKKHILMVNDNGLLKLILQGRSEKAHDVLALARRTPLVLIPTAWDRELLK